MVAAFMLKRYVAAVEVLAIGLTHLEVQVAVGSTSCSLVWARSIALGRSLLGGELLLQLSQKDGRSSNVAILNSAITFDSSGYSKLVAAPTLEESHLS